MLHPCEYIPCLNNGTCIQFENSNDSSKYRCNCQFGYTGVNCETAAICDGKPCQNGGTCNKNEINLCECMRGFSGLFCEIVERIPLAITSREELNVLYLDGIQVPLQYGGMWNVAENISMFPTTRLIAALAMDVNNRSENCYGLLASSGIDEFVSNVSDIDWKCTLSATVGWFQLGYDDGNWKNASILGLNFDNGRCPGMMEIPNIRSNASWIWNDPSPIPGLVAFCRGYLAVCDNDPCQNSGTCNRNSLALCTCQPGYSGTYCEQLIGYNVPNEALCANGAQAVNSTDGYYGCVCTDGYTGERCEKDVNDCLDQPCLNGGVCIDLTNAYHCICSHGFIGVNCEINHRLDRHGGH